MKVDLPRGYFRPPFPVCVLLLIRACSIAGSSLFTAYAGRFSDMKRYCTICHKIHDGRCKPETRANTAKPEFVKFRSSAAWQNKREAVRRRDLQCCRVCASLGIINNAELSVHHIVPLDSDWELRLDEENLITLCTAHHRQADAGRIPAAQLRRLAVAPLDAAQLLVRRG